jgi:hypothetical protein
LLWWQGGLLSAANSLKITKHKVTLVTIWNTWPRLVCQVCPSSARWAHQWWLARNLKEKAGRMWNLKTRVSDQAAFFLSV